VLRGEEYGEHDKRDSGDALGKTLILRPSLVPNARPTVVKRHGLTAGGRASRGVSIRAELRMNVNSGAT